GADGLHSVVRPVVVGDDVLRYSGQTCFRGLARVAVQRPHVMREVQGRGQRGSVCPIDDETVYWWVAHNSPPNALLAREARKPYLLQRYAGWPFGIGAAIDATPSDAILQNDLVDRKPIKTYASGRLVLIGDAAHPTTPNLGQGANMAIDDAIVLARSLRDESSITEGLQRYERERLPRTRLIVERSWSFGRMCLWDSALAVAVRELLVCATPSRVLRDMLRWQVLETVGPL
ncbi:MAG TPA: FAD-dependent monooxygenase, partial [Polyangiaceae bacterium]|nr:FAD-dependent monooxygenase [Polyangiaceae bacterium]